MFTKNSAIIQNLIKLGSETPSLQEHLKPVLDSLLGKNAYVDTRNETINYYTKKIRQSLEFARSEGYRFLEEADAIEKSWDKWDVDALMRLGVFDRREAKELKKALEQQSNQW